MTEYIKREDVLALSHYDDHDCEIVDVEDVEKLPSADVVPVRHGRWLIKTIRGDKRTVCSECLLETGTCYEENYCPNCGARMERSGE